MFALLVVLALVLVFALSGVAGHLDARWRKHGPHALAWRLVSGKAHHGKELTNRGLKRPGTKALTPSGHAHRRYYWPRWQHALWRCEYLLAGSLLAAALVVHRQRAVTYLGVTAAAGVAWGSWRAVGMVQAHSHRKNYVKPLHARLAVTAGIPLANAPESWIDAPKDRSRATLTWPRGAVLPSPQDRDTIASTAAATLGIGNAKKTWQFTGPHIKLHLVPPIPAPRWVGLDRIEWDGKRIPGVAQDAIRQAILEAGVDELVLGIGEEGRIVKISWQESPHVALSVDSGNGKSVTVRCLVPQILFRGGVAAVLDNKLVSHPSLRGLPNVAYCDDIDKIHDFLVWLDGELTRRAEYIRDHTDVYGNLTGSPGPRLVVVLEEQNLLMNRLRSYWADRVSEDRALPKEDREYLPAVSPAVRGFENASYVGRELKVHLVFIAQRFSAEAAGGGSKGAAVRMNAGIRMLAGYDDDTWKMLVGKGTPMPAPSRHKGRFQLYVKGVDLTEVQIAFFTHAEAREMAQVGGTPNVPAKLRHLTLLPQYQQPAAEAPPARDPLRDAPHDPVTAVITDLPQLPMRNWMTIAQARDAGLLPETWRKPAGAFRTAKHRAAKQGIPVPEVMGMNGGAAMYDATELADFLEKITSGRQAA